MPLGSGVNSTVVPSGRVSVRVVSAGTLSMEIGSPTASSCRPPVPTWAPRKLMAL